MRVLIGHWGHEANTFAEHMASYEEYTGRGPTFGQESIRANRGLPSYLGGIIKACEEDGVEMVPTCAYTGAAPILDRDCTHRMLESILSVCRENKGKLDGVCIALHGAGVSELSDDLEVYVLKEIRAILGDEIPITVPMDLHGNVSVEMGKLTQGLFGIRKYPHTDKAEASYRAMKTLARIIRKEIQTQNTVLHLPLIFPISAGLTSGTPFPELERFMETVIEEKGLIDASFFHGFPYADVPCGSASIVVVAQRDATKEAEKMARFLWERRELLRVHTRNPKEAMEEAKAEIAEGYIVINESSDNPGGGCPGDGTHLLREMLSQNLPGSIFGYITDPEAAKVCFQHRPGDEINLTLGGRHEAIFGEPLKLKDAKIISLSDGVFHHTSPNLKGLRCTMGNTARIRVGNVDIIISSNRNQTFDDRPFAVTGADLNEYRYVGLKSTQHFRSFFESRAARILSCDPPGLVSSNLSFFPFEKIPRPIWPLDENVEF